MGHGVTCEVSTAVCSLVRAGSAFQLVLDGTGLSKGVDTQRGDKFIQSSYGKQAVPESEGFSLCLTSRSGRAFHRGTTASLPQFPGGESGELNHRWSLTTARRPITLVMI
jgi:hypothetical protein